MLDSRLLGVLVQNHRSCLRRRGGWSRWCRSSRQLRTVQGWFQDRRDHKTLPHAQSHGRCTGVFITQSASKIFAFGFVAGRYQCSAGQQGTRRLPLAHVRHRQGIRLARRSRRHSLHDERSATSSYRGRRSAESDAVRFIV